jgi:hypothetical protein
MNEAMTETQIEAPKKKPAKKKAKKRAFPRARIEAQATAAKVPSEFVGITTTECCDGCNADGCVISGINVCAHPMKGGLQSAQMRDPEALKRFNRAKGALRDQMIDLRGR